jgi:hypothetical protein
MTMMTKRDEAGARPRTLNLRTLKRERVGTANLDIEGTRPRTRDACRDGPRPCLYIACRFHLYVDVNPRNGSLKLNFPDREPWEIGETCALDVAERGGLTLEEIGRLLNVTRERARQVEQGALVKLRDTLD